MTSGQLMPQSADHTAAPWDAIFLERKEPTVHCRPRTCLSLALSVLALWSSVTTARAGDTMSLLDVDAMRPPFSVAVDIGETFHRIDHLTVEAQGHKPDCTRPEIRRRCWDINEGVLRRSPDTADGMVEYLRRLEDANPGAPWQALVTRLHYYYHPFDGCLTLYGHPLFETIPEETGWETIELPDTIAPRLIVLDDGTEVDCSHVFPALRSLFGRNRFESEFWGRVNTHWGDAYQVWNSRLTLVKNDGCTMLPGPVRGWVDMCREYGANGKGLSRDQFQEAWQSATRWFPESQR